MDLNLLAQILDDSYNNAYNGEMVAQIHLFGIKYGKIIRDNTYTAKSILEKTSINESYITELNKGIKLSSFLDLTEENELTIQQLGDILKSEYNNAKNKEAVVSIHIFGIRYGQLIKRKNYSLNDIIKISEINTSYLTELHKGLKLSEYITI